MMALGKPFHQDVRELSREGKKIVRGKKHLGRQRF